MTIVNALKLNLECNADDYISYIFSVLAEAEVGTHLVISCRSPQQLQSYGVTPFHNYICRHY